MTLSATARRTMRRAAISGTARGVRWTHMNRRIWKPSRGVAVLLLHNTLGRQVTDILSHIDANRELYCDYKAVENLGSATATSQIALSFDDGFHSNLAMARELHTRGIQACFYVPTNIIGADQARVDSFFRRPQIEGVLDWRELEEIASMGHIIGSHCRDHRPLIDQPDAQAEDQIKGSLAVLRDTFGDAKHFAWPFGALRYVDADKVARWCREADAIPASGVRGFNETQRFEREGYLRRDAADPRWIVDDIDAFLIRDALRS
ncbi:polysaccharide deacetylase family protein [Janibacter sp. G349]|uniref:polysaccharide deacetylase family protein n=1 Tax=Janibacter sp. G349 TaxID=3405424 RepID=UPI003B77FA02